MKIKLTRWSKVYLPIRDRYICQDRLKGRTFEDIAVEYGVTKERIRQICVKEGVWNGRKEYNGMPCKKCRRIIKKEVLHGARGECMACHQYRNFGKNKFRKKFMRALIKRYD